MTLNPEKIAASDLPSLLGLGFDQLRRPIWVFDDVRKRKVYANRAALDLWGAATLDDLLARDFSDQSPAVRTRMEDIAARIEGGAAVEERWTFYPNGAPVTVNTTISRIALPGGGHGMLLEGAAAEIDAQQQRAIEALRHTSALVSLYDADGFRIFGNPASLASYPGSGVRFAEIFANGDAGGALWSSALGGEAVEGAYRVITAQGERWHGLAARRTPDPVTGELCVLVNETDITEEVEAQSALADARELAEAAMAARQDFLANMSHELRTPLTSILGFTDLLAASPLTSEQQRRLGRIHDAGTVLLDTLNDVLDFAKLEAGGVDLETRPFELRALLNKVSGIFEAQALAKGLDLALQVDPACPDWLEGDADRLRQVLVNFLGNAIKFTGAGSVTLSAKYRVGASAGSARLELAVSDTGVGVPAAMLETVFERFAQAGPEVARKFGGTGLGLAISKEIVQLMGGEIGVDSIAGQGARFWCVLDLALAAAPEHRETEAAQDTMRPLNLLVADDNEANRELIGTLVRAMGHEVDVVADGFAAVEAAASGGYDLILMDVQMPRMDGLTATRAIRALGGDTAATPIIALTANVLPDQVAFYRASGMDDHVGKPINPRELLLKIAQWGDARDDGRAKPAGRATDGVQA
uniref:PAS domain-containing hybrid sensor histidine kinase/response regulator n=1 Tax=uncultured Caulobacter sp. TaxID=158749 RepID=UPI0025F3B7E0|nr:PAS domain-containing hybrid sensor histidine kinase/response regulator [uncultured Caulobacter sp.]